MKKLTMRNLERCFETALEVGCDFVAVKVEMRGFDQPEIIINQKENFSAKLEYYKKAYNEDLVLKTFDGIKIVGFTMGKSFHEIQQELLGIASESNSYLVLDSDIVELEVGDEVEVVDTGKEYTTYVPMVEHMINDFGLDRAEVTSGYYTKDLLSKGDRGFIVALHRHLDRNFSKDIIALICSEKGYSLIGTKGLGKVIAK